MLCKQLMRVYERNFHFRNVAVRGPLWHMQDALRVAG
jgi:hypothetical protein